MWLIPLFVIGALVLASASRSPREVRAPRPPQLPGPPGPIAVLGEFCRIGQVPPVTVVLCAIAEAETHGRADIAADIIRVFVGPRARQGMPGGGLPIGPEPPRGMPVASAMSPPPRGREPEAPPASSRPATDEELRAMLNADPGKFVEMAARGVPMVEVPVESAPSFSAPSVATPPPPPVAVPSPPASANVGPASGSPLAGVQDRAWSEFVARLERESPLFSSSRHIGQYRQRRDRLAELGLAEEVVHGSPQAQRIALDVDLADAHRHAVEGGLLAEHLGRPIAVPGRDESEALTLSGLLGVIQCAGLEGAVGWLEQPGDRRRYPHTTQAFLRTNGVF